MRGEAVIVQEYRVEVLIEEGRRQRTLEVIETKVDVLERGQSEDDVREWADEPVVARIELMEELKVGEALRDDATEAVGVNVEERCFGQQAKLGREVPGNVAAVEVRPGHDVGGGVVGRWSANNAIVVAYIGAHPVAGEVVGIRIDGVLPGLEGHVGTTEAGVGYFDVNLDIELEVLGKLFILGKSYQLATSDGGSFNVCKAVGEGEVEEDKAEEEEEGAANGGLHLHFGRTHGELHRPNGEPFWKCSIGKG